MNSRKQKRNKRALTESQKKSAKTVRYEHQDHSLELPEVFRDQQSNAVFRSTQSQTSDDSSSETTSLQSVSLDEEQESQLDLFLKFSKARLDIRPAFIPLTKRKVAMWSLYLAIAGSIAALEVNYKIWDKMEEATKQNLLGVMIFLYAFEPAIFALSILFSKYPANLHPKPEVDDRDIEAQRDLREEAYKKNEGVAMIVTCYESRNEIGATVESFMKVVRPEQVFLMHNHRTPTPPDDTEQVAKAINPNVNYYYDALANKTKAVVAGLEIAKEMGLDYAYIGDDDVAVPEGWFLEKELLTGDFKAIVYPIDAARKDFMQSIITDWQGLEYKKSDTMNGLLECVLAVWLLHGAAYAGKIDDIIEVLQLHNAIFNAEDVRTGILFARLFKKLRLSGFVLPTIAPKNFWELAEQRIVSWNWGANLELLRITYNLLFVWQLPITFLATRKVTEIYSIYSILVDWARIPIMVLSAGNPMYWARMGIIIAANEALLMAWHYGKLRQRPELQSRFISVLTMPFYQQMQNVFTTFALMRYLFIYLPNVKPTRTIAERIKRGEFDFMRKYLDDFPRGSKVDPFEMVVRRLKMSGISGIEETTIIPVREADKVSLPKELEQSILDLTDHALTLSGVGKSVGYVGAGLTAILFAVALFLKQLNNEGATQRSKAANSIDLSLFILCLTGMMLLNYLISKMMAATSDIKRAISQNEKILLFASKEPESVAEEKRRPILLVEEDKEKAEEQRQSISSLSK